MEAPMPLDAPVTTATLSLSVPIVLSPPSVALRCGAPPVGCRPPASDVGTACHAKGCVDLRERRRSMRQPRSRATWAAAGLAPCAVFCIIRYIHNPVAPALSRGVLDRAG